MLVTSIFSFSHNVLERLSNIKSKFKGGYLDFSHLTELNNIFITEIYRKTKSSINKNYEFTKKNFFDGVPLKDYVASYVIFRFCARNKKKSIFGISSD